MIMTYPFRRTMICALVCVLATPWGVAAAAERFVGGMEHVPLMTGLAEIAEERLEIDSPAGPIVQVTTTGSPTKAEVLAFYTETLPRLGWRSEGAGVFCREGKTLAIEMEESVSPWITVRFALFPEDATKSP